MINKGDFVVYKGEMYEVKGISGSTLSIRPLNEVLRESTHTTRYGTSGDSVTTTTKEYREPLLVPVSMVEKTELGNLIFGDN